MRVVFARAARKDLLDILDYIAAENTAAAAGVYARIVAAAKHPTEFPGMGRAGQLSDTRELLVAGSPYVIVYAVRDTTITILAVLHTARDLPRLLNAQNGMHKT